MMLNIEFPLGLLEQSIKALERNGCTFWACEGPTLTPIPMVTCNSCALLAQLYEIRSTPKFVTQVTAN